MKRKRHLIIPALLLIYAAIMAYIGRDALHNPDGRLRYFITIAAELVLIVAVGFTLRWRDKMRQRREDSTPKN